MRYLIFAAFIVISILYYISGRDRILRRTNGLKDRKEIAEKKVSVIIPARNEEENLKKLLPLVCSQQFPAHEIIVVDDNSTDKTSEIATSFEEVKLVKLKEDPPDGWVGKSWALWNGFLNSSGDYLLFLDADVEPSDKLIEYLSVQRAYHGGLISVWPYQRLEKFYEHLTLPFNLLVIYASNTLGFPGKIARGSFGPVVFTSREDYEKTGGHSTIRDGILEDIKLAKLYAKHGIKVTNFLGDGLVQFRMYPNGIKQLLEGFSKNMSSGAITGGTFAFLLALIWMAGIYTSIQNITSIFLETNNILDVLIKTANYLIVALFIRLLSKDTGQYRIYDALFYPIHYIFFLIVFFYSLYLTLLKKQVYWRGRKLKV
ncbi:glycosyltransferase [Fervidobacterium gondwanense]|uniref:Glycosyltransferase, catalytic subunit of cellulose synthase and poly-beta-1,6-N-acetylglucosamine synthase n=1 Tax=Fervidobacterium gondwanense DSM 13020 TaxID=1121883 RepID=A0A1M7SJR4_FERGO|nr:glycosyltransferase family 2 protein [Fervidobacterium gondwanense]SHN58684.1 Glycosyltransferase, catalytic subunit of cellulose synthase and poly-beta-1,6-N-acetylglucosamine synthase [Fervidobacterium gondwanense DSM 13020]